MIKLSEIEARKLGENEFWKDMSYRDRAEFQLFTDRLCMPFSIFHEALEKTLNRPVYTHELALDYAGLQNELLGLIPSPSIDQIINLIPENKRILIQL